jgi:acetyltransferase
VDEVMDLASLFAPASVAIIGASETAGKAGANILANLLRHGYDGAVYPVNPRGGRIQGLPAYPALAAVPGSVELAFITVPAEGVAAALEQCATRRVRAAVICTSGFGETGPEGQRREADLVTVARRAGIRCVGPNTVGFVSMARRLVGSFVPLPHWEDGPIALAAQSGMFAGIMAQGLMSRSAQRPGLHVSLPFGNKMDVDETDFLEHVEAEPAVEVVGLHLEAIRRPPLFLQTAARVAARKPVIVFKSGRSDFGARAAASHTGSLAANDVLVEAAFRQTGLLRAYSLEEFLGTLKAFSMQPLPRGPRVGVLTTSGAWGVMAADELIEAGLLPAQFQGETCDRVRRLLPEWAPAQNPLDFWMALGDSRRGHAEVLDAVLGDPGVDAVLAILSPYETLDFEGVRELFADLRPRHKEKPLLLSLYGGPVRDRWERELEGLRIPIYESTAVPAKALGHMYRYALRRGLTSDPPQAHSLPQEIPPPS